MAKDKTPQEIADEKVKAAGGTRRLPTRSGGLRTHTFSGKKAIEAEKKRQEDVKPFFLQRLDSLLYEKAPHTLIMHG